MRLILASGSARRPELLAALGLPFEVVPTDVDESSDERDPVALTRDLALRKARAGAASAPDAVVIGADTLVVLDGRLLAKPANAAEARATLEGLRGRTHQVVSGVAVVAANAVGPQPVLRHDEPVGPEPSLPHANPFVLSQPLPQEGPTVEGRSKDGRRTRYTSEPAEGRGAPASNEGSDVVTTHVTMRAYTDEEIAAYIASGDPLDKSGAYAIQHPTFTPAARVEGCLCSVIGLPLWTLRALLWDVARIETQPPAFERCAECPCRH